MGENDPISDPSKLDTQKKEAKQENNETAAPAENAKAAATRVRTVRFLYSIFMTISSFLLKNLPLKKKVLAP